MDYTPPITQRSDKELLNIISNDETWAKEIQLQAEEELYRRNLSKEFVEAEKQKRVRLLATIHKRKSDKLAKNKAESYTAREMLLIILWFLFPYCCYSIHYQSL